MTRCCNARGCDTIFSARVARRAARKYRTKGLDKTARRIVDFLAAHDVAGASVLEVGGGIGEIEIELLKRGAARAVNLELSPAYAEEARRLLREEGLEGRIQWRIHDVAAEPETIEPADVVVLNRVVCCYPDYRRLLGAAADHARRFVVFSYPRRHALLRMFVAGQNLTYRGRGREFRTFVHPPPAMLAAVEERGFRRSMSHAAPVWQIAAFERAAPTT